MVESIYKKQPNIIVIKNKIRKKKSPVLPIFQLSY